MTAGFPVKRRRGLNYNGCSLSNVNQCKKPSNISAKTMTYAIVSSISNYKAQF